MKRFLLLVVFVVALVLPANSDWSERQPEFVYARLQCSNRDSWYIWPEYYPFNEPWHHDYPFADQFFVGLLSELTGLRVTPDAYKIVRLDSDEIYKYPFLYLSEPGFLDLNDSEIRNLGEYL